MILIISPSRTTLRSVDAAEWNRTWPRNPFDANRQEALKKKHCTLGFIGPRDRRREYDHHTGIASGVGRIIRLTLKASG